MDKINRTSGSRGALEYGKFRENSKGETVVATVDDSELNVVTLNITESGNHEIVVPSLEEAIRVKGFYISNNSGTDVDISFREETDGELKYTTHLIDEGHLVERSLPGAWALGNGRALNVYASGDCDVYVTIEYEGPAESEEEKESLGDSLSISEEIAVVSGKNVIDTITIAEAETETTGRSLLDSIDIVDSGLVITGDRSKALSDEVSVAEAVGNSATLNLNDSISFAEGSVRELTVN